MKKGDYIIGVLILAAAALLLMADPARAGGDLVKITLEGREYAVYPSSERMEFDVTGRYANHVVIEGGGVRVARSDCPGKECVHMGELRGAGVIVCLPNRMVITFAGGRDDSVDVVT